jgi:hypothetical protein
MMCVSVAMGMMRAPQKRSGLDADRDPTSYGMIRECFKQNITAS